jgi:hypothetical protein
VFFVVLFCLWGQFCIINFTITIFLLLFLPLHFLTFSCAIIHCSPSQLLYLLLCIHSLPHLHLCLLSSPNLSPHYLSLLHTHHLLTSQLCTPPVPCNPWHKHPPLQQQKYTQTCTRATKPSSLCVSSPTHLPFFPLLLFSVTFTNSLNFYIYLNNDYPPQTPTVYRYYHQGVFCICKQLLRHWTCEVVIAKLYLHARDRKST